MLVSLPVNLLPPSVTALFAVVGFIATLLTLWTKLKSWSNKIEDRRELAKVVFSFVDSINKGSQWDKRRFTELEVEVRDAKTRRPHLLPGRTRSWRVESLREAVRQTSDPVILLEAEAGAGKSVTLREFAQKLAAKAESPLHSSQSQIAVYIDLKALTRDPSSEPIDSALIERFVINSLNDANFPESDLPSSMRTEIAEGRNKGSWLYLFDSFDELPEIVNATTDANEKIQQYTAAIKAFLGFKAKSRAIIASRPFRGPNVPDWPRFRLVDLSEARQHDLIAKFFRAKPSLANDGTTLIGELRNASSSISSLAANPLFLSLLCERSSLGLALPSNILDVFEGYMQSRMADRSADLERRFQTTPAELRLFAEHIAFAMTADASVGFSAKRGAILESLKFPSATLIPRHDLFDALEDIGIASRRATLRSAPSITQEDLPFSFAHRRFQEFFATCILRNHPKIVSFDELLLDGKWRETLVALLQNQSKEAIDPILARATQLLDGAYSSLSASTQCLRPFFWPQSSLHILSELQDGLNNRPDVSLGVRAVCSQLINAAWVSGNTSDKKLALQVVGSALPETVLDLIRKAFPSDFELLREVAYRQAAQLNPIPLDIAQAINASLLRMAFNGRLRRERYAVFFHLGRLTDPAPFLRTARLCLTASILDVVMSVFSFAGISLMIPSWLKEHPWPAASISQKLPAYSQSFLPFAFLAGWMLWSTYFRSPRSPTEKRYQDSLRLRCFVRTGFVLLSAAAVISLLGLKPVPAILILLLTGYPSAFVSSLVSAVPRGHIPQSPWWLLLPMGIARRFSISDATRSLLAGLAKLTTALKKHRSLVLSSCAVLGIMILDSQLSKHVYVPPVNWLVHFAARPVWVVGGAAFVIFVYGYVLISIVVVPVTCMKALRNTLAYGQWRQSVGRKANKSKTLSGFEFLNIALIRFGGDASCARRFLRTVLHLNLLESTPQAERMLSASITIVEAMRSHKPKNVYLTVVRLEFVGRVISTIKRIRAIPSFNRVDRFLFWSKPASILASRIEKHRSAPQPCARDLAAASVLLQTWIDQTPAAEKALKKTEDWSVETITLLVKLREQTSAKLPEDSVTQNEPATQPNGVGASN